MDDQTTSLGLLDQIDAQVAINDALARDIQSFRSQAASAMPGSISTSDDALLTFAAAVPLPLDPEELNAGATMPLFQEHVALLGDMDKSDILPLTEHDVDALSTMLKTSKELSAVDLQHPTESNTNLTKSTPPAATDAILSMKDKICDLMDNTDGSTASHAEIINLVFSLSPEEKIVFDAEMEMDKLVDLQIMTSVYILNRVGKTGYHDTNTTDGTKLEQYTMSSFAPKSTPRNDRREV